MRHLCQYLGTSVFHFVGDKIKTCLIQLDSHHLSYLLLIHASILEFRYDNVYLEF